MVFRKNLWKEYKNEVAKYIGSINQKCEYAEKEAALAVAQMSVKNQEEAKVFYEKSLENQEKTIAWQERQGKTPPKKLVEIEVS